jgi:hypothetical protein
MAQQPPSPDTVQIDDLTEQVTVTTDNPPALGTVTTVGEQVKFTYTEPLPVALGEDGFFYRNILEADGTLSDRFIIDLTLGSRDVQVIFESDPDILTPLPPDARSLGPDITESGDYQTVATYKNVDTGEVLTDYQVRSVVKVPETGSFAVVGMVWASLLVFARIVNGHSGVSS